MNEYICVICEEVISADTIAKRHYSFSKPMPPIEKMTCSRKCQNLLRSRDGLYSRMSQRGRDARSKAVAKSNKENPRRRKDER